MIARRCWRGMLLVGVPITLAACHADAAPPTATAADHSAAGHKAGSAQAALPAVAIGGMSSIVADPGMRSCADEMGDGPARDLARQCIAVSPATHPPCNATNSCALIRDEIARSCDLMGPQGADARACVGLIDQAQQAVALIERYYAAIDARDYGTAYGQWGSDGAASTQSFAQFRAGFVHTRSVRVTVDRVGQADGAAGSLFIDIPVDIRAILDDGRRQHFTGTYTLRRINHVDGADAASLRWHIVSAVLRPVGQH